MSGFRPLIVLLCFAALLSSCAFNKQVFYTGTPLRDLAQVPHEEVVLTTPDSVRLVCLFLKPESTAAATIFMLQGQGGNVTTLAKLAEPFRKHGFQVFLMGYRGYGQSEGEPSFANAYEDSRRALEQLRAREEAQGKPVIVLGYSLGGNIAIKLAREHPDLLDALVVEGTFTTLNREAVAVAPIFLKPFAWALMHSGYNAKRLIAEIRDPVLIIHSRDDDVVPFRMGRALYRRAPEPKTFWEIRGGHCMGITNAEQEYIRRLHALTARR